LSAKVVREIAHFGGPLAGLVPPSVEKRLRAKVS
jgi:phosphopantetheine adenylyltransferase